MPDIDLDAIRARHQPVAGLRDDEGHLFEPATFCRHCVTLWPCDANALLAEVDWLQRLYAAGLNETLEAKARADILADAMVDRNIDRWDRGVEHERARALPVIEAARAACDHLNEHGCDTGVPLRTALAEYDR